MDSVCKPGYCTIEADSAGWRGVALRFLHLCEHESFLLQRTRSCGKLFSTHHNLHSIFFMMALRLGSRVARRSATSCRPQISSSRLPAAASRHASSSSSSSPLDSEERTQRTNPAPGPPKPNSPFTIFDRNVKVMQRDRAAQRKDPEDNSPGSASRVTDYVRMAAAENISERILDIRRNFETVVEVGSGPGYLRHHLDPQATGVKKIIMCDSSREMLYRDEHLDKNFPFEIERVVLDEEQLPFEPDSFDCIVSSGALHWTNDLPGALIQIQRSLRPDGVFIGSIYGGDTLFELRTSLQLAEQEREGGISPRISPMTDTRDCSSLLTRAGFNIPTVDIDEVSVGYPSIFELMTDLQDMGESNAVINRRPLLQRDTLLSASAIYSALHGQEEGMVPATFGIIYLIGWKPHPSQAKPAERGSATHSMKDLFGGDEASANSPEGPPPQGGVPPPPGGGKTRSFSTSARRQQEAKKTSNADYYNLMNLTPSQVPQNGWYIDLGELKRVWRLKQGETHPDRMHNKSASEQELALTQSSLINKAYDTLKDPLNRACYLLELNSIEVPSESDSLEDMNLLMKVMELRENLDEVTTEEEIQPIAQINQEYYDTTVKELGQAFENNDFETAKKKTVELRYWSNIAKVCREWTPGSQITMQH
ncbi:unnamed protein product [Sympodiomycopsis kandeliae]